MRAASYIRVSTGKQVVEGLSLDAQEDLGPAYAAGQGWQHLETFIEEGVSGRRRDRPALDALLRRLSEFDVVIIPKIDRLGRSARDTLNIYDEMEKQGVALVCLKPQLDTTTAAGRMMRTILAAAAEFESDMTSERVIAVNAGRARAGKFMGSSPPYGYRRERAAGLIVAPEQAAIVERIFREFAGGVSQKGIARGLNEDGVPGPGGGVWRQSRLSRMLRNVVYAGRVTLHGEEFDGTHPAIIPVGTWDSVSALLSALSSRSGQGRGRPSKGRHLFTQGLLRCAHCGYAMAPRTDMAGIETYICLGRTVHGPDYCPQRGIPREPLDSAAFAYFSTIYLDEEAAQRQLEDELAARRREAAEMLNVSRRDVRDLERALGRFDADYGAGLLDVAEWRALRGGSVGDLSTAQDRVRALDARVVSLEGDAAGGARDAVLARVADLRRAVAGQIAGAAGLEDVRGQLLRLFERFDVGRTDVSADPDLPLDQMQTRALALADIPRQHITAGVWVVLPWPRPEVVDPLELSWRPSLDK